MPLLLVPMAQEISAKPCDVGFGLEELKSKLRPIFLDEKHDFDETKIDYNMFENDWNSKTGIYEASLSVVEQRASELRNWLRQRSERTIVLVTHGAFLHYFTEDWLGFSSTHGTAYKILNSATSLSRNH